MKGVIGWGWLWWNFKRWD